MSHAALPGSGKKPEKAANHERWVISYADLLTLLLATFVVLYASSVRDKHRLDEVSASFVKAFHGTPPSVVQNSGGAKGIMTHQPSPVPKPVEFPATKLARDMAHRLQNEIADLQALRLTLQKLLQPLIDKHEVSIVNKPLTLTIQLDASVLFPSGEADLKPAAIILLNQVGASLTTLPPAFMVVVQGYTDDQPIDTAQFSSNWALSAARAVRVVELFCTDKVNGGQLAAQGFGQFAPVAPNINDAGRALNRRVVIVVHAPDPTAQ